MAPPARTFRPLDALRYGWVILQEAAGSFIRNSDLRQASSLAFYSTLALIPALLLLTFLLSVGIGSSQAAQQKTSEFILEVIPRFGEVILHEVGNLSSHPRAAGTLNLLVLTWSLTPLVSSLREIVNGIFRVRNPRTLLASKAMDLAMGMAFITGLAGVAGAGLLFHYLARLSGGIHQRIPVPATLNFTIPFIVTVLLVGGVYFAFTSKVRLRHLLGRGVNLALGRLRGTGVHLRCDLRAGSDLVGVALQGRREIFQLQDIAFTQGTSALHGIFQLPNVARPIVGA